VLEDVEEFLHLLFAVCEEPRKVTRNKYSPFSPLNLWLNGHKVLWQ
jgi:hypothetical protein